MTMVAALAGDARAVIFVESGDPAFHNSTPGDNSGWQYEGRFIYFLAVPIGPYHFITAKHIGGTVGVDNFVFHGDTYTTISKYPAVDNAMTNVNDFRIWEVDHSKPFPTWAPLSTGAADIGATATIMGRGTNRGAAVVVGGEQKGWLWTSGDTQRWGRNVIVNTLNGGSTYGTLLYCNFDNLVGNPGVGVPGECTLSTGDSGGGLFVLENGLWRLAGINLSVDSPFREPPSGPSLYAALYDVGDLDEFDGINWNFASNTPANKPASFYATRISTWASSWISPVTGVGATSIASENFSAWQHLYFTPAEIATPASSGPLADFDGDGIKNVIEFAINLDPTFSEAAIMTAGTGFRGLPLVKRESVSGQQKVTVEFVRRTTSGGAGLTYTAQFSSDLVNWSAGDLPTVIPINTRWDRVKVVDTVVATSTPKRFARIKVEQ